MKRIYIIILLFLFLVTGISTHADAFISDTVPASNLSDAPTYEGSDYIVLQDDQPDFDASQLTITPYVIFSKLDELGRTGVGMACLGPETLPTKARGEIGDIRPSGWQTIRYDDLIEDRYLYNRTHVIGYLLCGDNATPENIFTGTRYLNAGAMLIFESQVADYIERTSNHVIYRCTPFYIDDNLVASGVQIEAYSVEDVGKLRFNVYIFNIQPGIVIDYSTGDSWREGNASAAGIIERSAPQETEAPKPTYILNTNTKKFHYPNCSSVKDIKDKNKKEFYGTRDEIISKGYSPCGRCHP